MIEDTLDIKEKISIINHSDLADFKVLDRNYMDLIHDTFNTQEKQQFTILHLVAQKRIKQLTY